MSEQIKILVVEDETVGAESLRHTLAFTGYNVIAVIDSGEDAIKTIVEDQPDLILMDISLRGKIDGIKATEEIHARFNIPVIYLTAHAENAVFERAKETGPYAFLTKPLDVRQLHYAIEIALRKHTLQNQLEKKVEMYHTIFDVSDNAVMLVDDNAAISIINEKFELMSGFTKVEVEGQKSWGEFFQAEECIKVMEGLSRAKSEAETTQNHFETVLFDKEGGTKHVYTTVKFVPSSCRYIISMSDISDLKRSEVEINNLNDELQKISTELAQEIGKIKKSEMQLRHQAYHDPLTGLPNRILLFDRIKQAFAFEERHKSLLALILLDLDGFKEINDAMGHSSGDALLQELAQRLRRCMRQYDTVGRIGGDEFVIAVNDIQNIHDIFRFVEKVKDLFREPFDIHGQQVHITASLGVSLYPINATDIETLLQMADVAMYAAKKSGKNAFRFFSESMDMALSDRTIVNKMLRATQFWKNTLSEFNQQFHALPQNEHDLY